MHRITRLFVVAAIAGAMTTASLLPGRSNSAHALDFWDWDSRAAFRVQHAPTHFANDLPRGQAHDLP